MHRTMPLARLAALALLACVLPWPGEAFAHARLVRSKPAAGAELGAPPKAVMLWFNEAPEAEFSNVKVLDAAGAIVAEGAPVPAKDPNTLELMLAAPLRAGSYTVRYRVVAVDGHVLEGTFAFRVGSAPASK